MELAVDPADVDQETYPVRIRLTRPLTAYEAEGLASVEPGIRSEGDAIVLPAARLDDVARDVDTWSARLEQGADARRPARGRDAGGRPATGGRPRAARVPPPQPAGQRPRAALNRARAGRLPAAGARSTLNGPVTRDVIQPP